MARMVSNATGRWCLSSALVGVCEMICPVGNPPPSSSKSGMSGRESEMKQPSRSLHSLPPEEALASLGAARQEA